MNEFFKNNEHHFHFIFRVVIGLLFVIHGIGKWGAIQSMSFNLFFFAGIIEILGGAFLIFGLFTRISALVCAIEIGYAFLFVHVFGKDGFNLNPVGATGNGGEAALLFFVSFLVIAATGPTSWSVQKE